MKIKVVEIKPDLAEAHYNLGIAYQEKGIAFLARQEIAIYKKLTNQAPTGI